VAFPLLPLFGIIEKVVDNVIPDKNKQNELKLDLAKLADEAAARDHELMTGQIDVNKEEAKNPNWFVSGWRPAVGWTCVAGIAYSFVLFPLLSFIAVVAGYKGILPSIATSDLMVLLTGMLGFGGLRTFDKIKGVAVVETVEKKTIPEKAPWDK
jgi:hypothetical protein